MILERKLALLFGISFLIGMLYTSPARTMEIIILKLQGQEFDQARAMDWYNNVFLPRQNECQSLMCYPMDQMAQVMQDNTGPRGCHAQSGEPVCSSPVGSYAPFVYHPDFSGP